MPRSKQPKTRSIPIEISSCAANRLPVLQTCQFRRGAQALCLPRRAKDRSDREVQVPPIHRALRRAQERIVLDRIRARPGPFPFHATNGTDPQSACHPCSPPARRRMTGPCQDILSTICWEDTPGGEEKIKWVIVSARRILSRPPWARAGAVLILQDPAPVKVKGR